MTDNSLLSRIRLVFYALYGDVTWVENDALRRWRWDDGRPGCTVTHIIKHTRYSWGTESWKSHSKTIAIATAMVGLGIVETKASIGVDFVQTGERLEKVWADSLTACPPHTCDQALAAPDHWMCCDELWCRRDLSPSESPLAPQER